MLQQTQVQTVIPYYERFLARFPTVCALAQAELDEVLALWEGLGYYARARHLHAAAKLICERHGGELPATLEELLALPGIGEYTAGAILSIAFGQDVPAIDANAARVLCRLFDLPLNTATAAAKRVLRRHAQELLPPGRAAEFNQALMELGSTLCRAKAPQCAACPLAPFCQAYQAGTQALRPLPKRRTAPPLKRLAAAFVERDGRLLLVRRRPEGLLGGLWELPSVELASPEEPPAEALSRLFGGGKAGECLAVIQHAYSHFRIEVAVCRYTLEEEPTLAGGPWDRFRWLSPQELASHALTGATRKTLQALGWPTAGRSL